MNPSMSFKGGVALTALLGAADVLLVGAITADDGPPAWALLLSGVFGLLTLAALRPLVRGSQQAFAIVVASRGLSALLGIPAFFVDDAPSWAAPSQALAIALTVAAILLLARGRSSHLIAAR